MFWIDSQGRPGSYVSVHVTRFSSLRAQVRWRRTASRLAPKVAGLRFAKAMTSLGGGSTYGFGSDLPDPRRQIAITIWKDVDAYDRFTSSPLGGALSRPGYAVLTQALSTRGTFLGRRPIDATGDGGAHEDGLAVITLGRTTFRSLPRFIAHGVRLASPTLEADGLVTAASAGFPPTGNATFSIWEDGESMHRFAYGDRDCHRATARATPPILREQINARLRPLRIEGNLGDELAHNAERLREVAAALVTASS